MISTTAKKVRLITAAPFGPKTERFINSLSSQPNLSIQEVRSNSLPNDYVSSYSETAARQAFMAHQSFYLSEVRAAISAQQFPLLVSGQTHHFSAPFLVALQRAYDLYLKVVAFDNHSDCYQSRFDAGGFWIWLMENNYLRGEDLILVGIQARPKGLCFSQYYPPALKAELDSNFDSFAQAINQGRAPAHDFIMTIVKRHIPNLETFFALFPPETDTPFYCGPALARTLDIETIWTTLSNDFYFYYSSLHEQNNIRDNNIAQTSSGPIDLSGQNVFASLDTDVSYDRNFTIEKLSGYFRMLSTARVLGLHVEELDSPRTKFVPEEVGEAVTRLIAA